MKTTELTIVDREEISRLLCSGCSFADIGKSIGKSRSCISREVSRYCSNRNLYRACFAQQHAIKKKKQSGRKRKLDQPGELRNIIIQWIRLQWSPGQIVERLRMEYPERKDMRISPETIYSYLYVHPKECLRRELIKSLRRQHKIRKKRKGSLNILERRGKIPAMVSIEERPKEVEGRIIPGHWEGDLVMGKWRKSAIGTLTERTTRLAILVPLKSTDPATVRQAFARHFKALPRQLKQTLTYDQGKEMMQHVLFTKQTKIQVYFAHKSSPWERGTNENTNGLIRQYFPKGTDFNVVTKNQIKKVELLLNDRPRKCLGFRKPNEVFNTLLQ
jgi:IS30 family transposase